MFGLGFTELIFLGVLGLLLIGPKQLPEVARTVARFINELKRATEGLSSEFKGMADTEFKPRSRPSNQVNYDSEQRPRSAPQFPLNHDDNAHANIDPDTGLEIRKEEKDEKRNG
jgi:Sec-independent protein translocase protein TatA